MDFSLCSISFKLFFLSLTLTKTNGNPPVSNLTQSLQKELNDVVSGTETLKKGKDVLIKDINILEISCNDTLFKLEGARHSLVTILLNRNHTLGLLMQRLLEADVEHGKLEFKLKELYSNLDVLGVMYETKYQDLFLLESRRLRGIDLQCETIIKKLEVPTVNKKELQTRSLSSRLTKFQGNHVKQIALQNKISIAQIEESQLKSDYRALTMKKENIKELCNLKKSNLEKQIAYVEEVLKSFENGIEVLNSNINTSILLAESLKVEIQFGEKLLNTMKENIFKFKQVKESFKRDEQCYETIQETT